MIVHQATNYTQDLHYNIPKYWVVHNTLSRYMDRDGWMKAMMHSKTVCGANKLNPQVLLYDGHDIHFYDMAIDILHYHIIKPLVLKAGDS